MTISQDVLHLQENKKMLYESLAGSCQWLQQHCDVTIITVTMETERWLLYIVTLKLSRDCHFVNPFHSHSDWCFRYVAQGDYKTITFATCHKAEHIYVSDVDTTHFPCHVMAMWSIRIAFGSQSHSAFTLWSHPGLGAIWVNSNICKFHAFMDQNNFLNVSEKFM